jgi:hypothetical protein
MLKTGDDVIGVGTSPPTAVGLGRGRLAAPARALARMLAAQVEEIRNDTVLRLYGAGLALINVLTVLFWRAAGEQTVMDRASEPICWPLLPSCGDWRVLTAGEVDRLLQGFVLGSLIVAALFLRRRYVPGAYLGLLALNVAKLAVLALDYRLRHNQHYMALWATAVFLFVPGKRDALRVLIVLFYAWAGSLKLNWEWISGAALYRPLWFFTGAGVVFACAYVVVMELLVSWGLLASRAWIFWAAFAQIVLFHIMSWAIVDFFYPLLMFLLISIYPLARLWPPGDSRGLLGPLFRGQLRPATYAPAALFSLLQLTPYAFPGDRTITGEGRLYALHMFDARIACEAYASVRGRDGTVRRVDLQLTYMPRINCDPIVIFNRARNLCLGRSRLASDVVDLDLHLAARRTTDPILHDVIDVAGFCPRALQYDPFRHNDWIRSP